MTASPAILLIGASSFIGKSLSGFPGVASCSHNDPRLSDLIAAHDTIINCAFHPSLRDQPYDAAYDLDSKIAQSIEGTTKKLAILSSRAVYGPITDPMREDMTLQPLTVYARNKVSIEENCKNLLGNNLLAVRMSNIFGFEWPPKPGRISFMSQVLSSLKTKNEMIFDIAPHSEKDFLPVENAARVLYDLLTQGVTGTYNLGAGKSLAMSDVTDALKKGFGSGHADFQSDRVDSFYMDVSNLRKTGINLPEASEILSEFEGIGRKLATTEGI